MEFTPKITVASICELQEWWKNTPDWVVQDEVEMFFDELAYRFSQFSPEGPAFLRQYVYSTHLAQRRSALRFFTSPENVHPDVRHILVDTLHEDHLMLKNDALWVAIELAYFPFDKNDIEALTHHPNERLAATAEMYVCYAFPQERQSHLLRCLQSSNPRKREYACDFIGDEDLEEFLQELNHLKYDPHEDVRAAATSNAEFFEKTP